MNSYNPRVVNPLPTGDPRLIRRDVWIAMCEAAVLHHHPHAADMLRLDSTAPVHLSACLSCDFCVGTHK